MHIEMSVKTDRYRYLWLRYVEGFDPRIHCAKCLVGTYAPLSSFRLDRRIPPGDIALELDPHRAPYFYLCGVINYDDNLHIAFRHKPGGLITFEDAFAKVTITDAERLEIPPLPQEVITETQMPPAFHTCRNYRFGWHTFPDDRREMKGFARK